MAGNRLCRFVEDCKFPVLVSCRADRILNGQASCCGLAIRKEIKLDGGRSSDGAIDVGEAGMIERRPDAVRPLGTKTLYDKGVDIPAVRVAFYCNVVTDLKVG